MALDATAVLLAAGFAALVVAGGATALPRAVEQGDDAILLVVAAPWNGGAEAVVARAGGSVIGPERAMLAVLAHEANPEELRAAGAWAVVDWAGISFICGDGQG